MEDFKHIQVNHSLLKLIHCPVLLQSISNVKYLFFFFLEGTGLQRLYENAGYFSYFNTFHSGPSFSSKDTALLSCLYRLWFFYLCLSGNKIKMAMRRWTHYHIQTWQCTVELRATRPLGRKIKDMLFISLIWDFGLAIWKIL